MNAARPPWREDPHTSARKSQALRAVARNNAAHTERPIFASGIDNRPQTVVALCAAPNGRWTTTLRRISGGSTRA